MYCDQSFKLFYILERQRFHLVLSLPFQLSARFAARCSETWQTTIGATTTAEEEEVATTSARETEVCRAFQELQSFTFARSTLTDTPTDEDEDDEQGSYRGGGGGGGYRNQRRRQEPPPGTRLRHGLLEIAEDVGTNLQTNDARNGMVNISILARTSCA